MNSTINNFLKLTVLNLVLFLLVGCAKRFDCSDDNCHDSNPVQDSPPKQCFVDGCTLVPDFNFKHCCDEHDIAYWKGGSLAQRKKADIEFRQCIANSNQFLLAGIYYFGVRVGGTPILPTPWRWGFGWYYPDYNSGPGHKAVLYRLAVRSVISFFKQPTFECGCSRISSNIRSFNQIIRKIIDRLFKWTQEFARCNIIFD